MFYLAGFFLSSFFGSPGLHPYFNHDFTQVVYYWYIHVYIGFLILYFIRISIHPTNNLISLGNISSSLQTPSLRSHSYLNSFLAFISNRLRSSRDTSGGKALKSYLYYYTKFPIGFSNPVYTGPVYGVHSNPDKYYIFSNFVSIPATIFSVYYV